MLGGFLLPIVGVFGMISFGLCLFFNVGLTLVWLYLELCGLCLIPLFFSGAFLSGATGLFYYVVFSGIASCLLLLGILIPEGVFFLLGGFLMKFGVFPLWGWVYRVCCFSSWFVIWGFSTVLKVSFALFPLFLVLGYFPAGGVVFLCSLGCFFLSFVFWYFAYSWKICWCHMMLSSSMVLVGLGLSGCSIFTLLSIYLIYFLWATLALCYLYYSGECSDILEGGWSVFMFSFLFLSLPVSLSIFYKVAVCSCIFSSGFFLLLCWVIYSFSEQLFLFLFLTGLYSGKFSGGFLSLV